MPHVCPWWLAYTFDNALRRWLHPPEAVLGPYLGEGDTALDVGCGMGHFSIGMARLAGDTGKVTAVDLQQPMLDVLMGRARKAGVAHRIATYCCERDDIGTHEPADFALSFYMAHETPSVENLMRQLRPAVREGGRLLVVEPKLHVSASAFEATHQAARAAGFRRIESPRIRFSHAMLLG